MNNVGAVAGLVATVIATDSSDSGVPAVFDATTTPAENIASTVPVGSDSAPSAADPAAETPAAVENVPAAQTSTEQTEEVEEVVYSVTPATPHPFLTTNFADYTVTEGLLLCVVFCFVFSALIKLVKGVF